MSLTVTITVQLSGAVVATGGDALAHDLLRRGGFTRHSDWYGIRHRVPTWMPRPVQLVVVEQTVRMLEAARYNVNLDPALSLVSPVGAAVLGLTDQIRGAEGGRELARFVAQLVDGERGVLVRLQEALEAAAEQVIDLDRDAVEVSDRLGAAAEQLFIIDHELVGVVPEVAALASAMPVRTASQARASSPAASHSPVAPASGAPSAPKAPEAGKEGRSR
jgi:hypothetical protein